MLYFPPIPPTWIVYCPFTTKLAPPPTPVRHQPAVRQRQAAPVSGWHWQAVRHRVPPSPLTDLRLVPNQRYLVILFHPTGRSSSSWASWDLTRKGLPWLWAPVVKSNIPLGGVGRGKDREQERVEPPAHSLFYCLDLLLVFSFFVFDFSSLVLHLSGLV